MIAALSAHALYVWSEKVRNLINLPSGRIRQTAISPLNFAHVLRKWALDTKRRFCAGMSLILPTTLSCNIRYIPLTYPGRQQIHPVHLHCHGQEQWFPLSHAVLLSMMMLSLLAYQLDEFMELLVSGGVTPDTNETVRLMLNTLCQFQAVNSIS
jgi:hypothetical protein